jgi:uncharacterized OB-fold protein
MSNASKPRVIVDDKKWQKPLPNIDSDSAEFWEGLKRHELLLWTCGDCGASYWPMCYCVNHENQPFATNLSWKPSSGYGRIHSMNRHEYAFHAGFKEDVPYFYALVELDEGPVVSSTIVGKQPDGVIAGIGRRVRIVFEDHPGEDMTLPRFELVEEA